MRFHQIQKRQYFSEWRMINMKGRGWHNESQRHRMSAYGVKTGNMGASGKKLVARAYSDFLIDEIVEDDLRLRVYQDDDNSNDPMGWDNLGTIATWHRNYQLGNMQPGGDPQEFLDELEEEYGDNLVILPVYMYDHSGITINTSGYSCSWDSGQLGYIYVTPDEIIKEYGKLDNESKKKARAVLEAEIEIYDHHIRGNVYNFTLEKRDSCKEYKHDDWEIIDSVGGFIGDFKDNYNGMKDHIPPEAENMFKRMMKEGDLY